MQVANDVLVGSTSVYNEHTVKLPFTQIKKPETQIEQNRPHDRRWNVCLVKNQQIQLESFIRVSDCYIYNIMIYCI